MSPSRVYSCRREIVVFGFIMPARSNKSTSQFSSISSIFSSCIFYVGVQVNRELSRRQTSNPFVRVLYTGTIEERLKVKLIYRLGSRF